MSFYVNTFNLISFRNKLIHFFLYFRNVIKPVDNNDSDDGEPPAVKRRRQAKQAKKQCPGDDVPAFSGLEVFAGPGPINPQEVQQVPTFPNARRRLLFNLPNYTDTETDTDNSLFSNPFESSADSYVFYDKPVMTSTPHKENYMSLEPSVPIADASFENLLQVPALSSPLRDSLHSTDYEAPMFDMSSESFPNIPTFESLINPGTSQSTALLGVSQAPSSRLNTTYDLDKECEDDDVSVNTPPPNESTSDESPIPGTPQPKRREIPKSPARPFVHNNQAVNKNEKQKRKHPILPPCKCRLDCISMISQGRRNEIHTRFWEQDFNNRRNWILSHRISCESGSKHYYNISDERGVKRNVCVKFFLSTLGFSSNNILRSLNRSGASNSSLFVPEDKRGRHVPKHALKEDVSKAIDDHIEKFHPSISHYRREHAPNRRYISPEITIHLMYKIFVEEHPEYKIGYEALRRRISAKNIGFTAQGTLTCETCLRFKSQHEHDEMNYDADCEECANQVSHKERARISRKHYDMDKRKDNEPGTEVYVSGDMQKVIMLPTMKGIKSCVFTNRLVVFHETFAPMGEQKKKTYPKQTRAILWHEAIAGRSAADVSSAFVRAIRDLGEDAPNIIIWLDNCSAQNKNWFLYTTLARMMNDDSLNTNPPINSVTLKYLEVGHTFLSCDSFHGVVEKNMRRLQNLFNFKDFVSAVQTSGGGPRVIEMKPEDFAAWDRRVTTGKTVSVPHLNKNIQVTQFRKNSKSMFFKISHDDEDFKECDFLMKRTQKDIDDKKAKPEWQTTPRGIPLWKKDKITKELCGIMPEGKSLFWTNIATNGESVDLTHHDGERAENDISI